MRTKPVIPLVLTMLVLVGGCKTSSSSSAGSSAAPSAGQPAASPNAPGASSPASAAATNQPTGAAAVDAQGCPTSNTTAFAKTKFLLHTGLAFGAFHRYLYKPYRAGTLTSGTKFHRVLVISKAAASALFIKREIRLSIEDVKANPTLCNALAAPLTSLESTLSDAVNKIKSGDTSAFENAITAVTAVEGQAKKAGFPITENQQASLG